MAADPPEPTPERRDELARLPRGRHGLPAEFVAHNQRERLIAGFAEVVTKLGYPDTTIARITKEAAVSSRTFYKYFQTKEECFLAALDAVFEQAGTLVTEAWEAESEWPARVRAATAAALSFLAAEPALARLCTVEVMHGGPEIAGHWEQLIDRLAPYLEEGAGPEPPSAFADGVARGVLGGIFSLITRRVIAEGPEGLEALAPDLVAFALAPYLGASEAARVASAPA